MNKVKKLSLTFFAGMLAFFTSNRALANTRTPVVIFPAFYFSILEVTVHNQSKFPDCPKYGKFEVWFGNPNPSTEFSQVCQDKLLTLVVKSDLSKPVPWSSLNTLTAQPNFFEPTTWQFFNQPGVNVNIKFYGQTENAPFYEPLYAFLETSGYVRDVNIRVAGYDSRLTPDLDNFLKRTKSLIEQTYYQNNSTPVHLVGHSNGPLYIQYLLTHVSQQWKNKFIHGFTSIAANLPGQGLFYPVYFTGLNVTDFSFPTNLANAASSAAMYQTHPSSYMSSANPSVFKDQEVVVRTVQGGKTYTPQDNMKLFQDAGLGLSQQLAEYYTGFIKFAPPYFPNVDVYAEKGSGLDTIVGAELENLMVGQVVTADTKFLFRPDGDTNQEDITNNAIQVWSSMPCFRFEFTDNVGVDHFALPNNSAVLQRLLTNLQRQKSVCISVPSPIYNNLLP